MLTRNLYVYFFGLGCLFFPTVSGVEYMVQNGTDLAELPVLEAGDEVILAAGEYASVDVVLQFNGVAGNPAKVYASTAGDVQFTGNTRLIFEGQYGEIVGLVFGEQAGPLHKEGLVKFEEHSKHLTLHNCQFIHCNAGTLTDANWLFIEGYHHEVSRCSFEGKTSMNATVFIKPTEEDAVSVARAHRLVFCYFGPRTELGDNGYEAIRVSDSSRQAYEMQCDISYNYFYQAISGTASEMEVISNKSRGNIYRGNLLEDCDGQITLRHGRNCVVEENYIIGTGSTRESGIRAVGSGHIIRNNFIKDVNGSGLRSAICLMDGEYERTDNQYEGVQNTVVEGNVILNCATSINVGENKGYHDPPISTVFTNNKVLNTNDETLLALESDATFSLVSGNEFYTTNANLGDDLSALEGGYTVNASLDQSPPFSPVLLPDNAAALTGHDFSKLYHEVPATAKKASSMKIETSNETISLEIDADAGDYLNVYVSEELNSWALYDPSPRATHSGTQQVTISKDTLFEQNLIETTSKIFYKIEVSADNHHLTGPLTPTPVPNDVFTESEGFVTIEAEDYHASTTNGDSAGWSMVNADGVDYQTTTSGSVAVWENGAEMSYQVQFNTLGTYYIHPRFKAAATSDDSFFFGIDGTLIGQVNTGVSNTWVWDNNETEALVIESTGVYTIQIRRRESGLELDKFTLTTDAGASFVD